MMMSIQRIRELMLITPFVFASPAFAHHSFAMFDASKKVTAIGTVKELDWANPHVYLDLVVRGADGTIQSASFEGGSPAQLSRAGWTRESFRPGDHVTVVFNPIRSNASGGSIVDVTTESGKVLGNNLKVP